MASLTDLPIFDLMELIMLDFKAFECLLSAYVSCDATINPRTQSFEFNTTKHGRVQAVFKDGMLIIKLSDNQTVCKTTLDGLYEWLKENAPAFN